MNGVHEHEMYASNHVGWIVIFSFLFAGEAYDYMFECGGPNDTEKNARATASRTGALHRGRRNFLRDVALEDLPNG